MAPRPGGSPLDQESGYLLALALLGSWGGSRLFGPLGPIESLSQIGPKIGVFYPLIGMLGTLILVVAAVYTLCQATRGKSTDIARNGRHDLRTANWLFTDTGSAPLWLGVRGSLGPP
jgi:hypothetical protein